MDRLLVRVAGAAGVVFLAAFILGLAPFLGAEPTVGAGLSKKIPDVVVNRTLKGDRLPSLAPATVTPMRGSLGANELRPRPTATQTQRIPVGCEASFSPISAPALANVFRRCLT